MQTYPPSALEGSLVALITPMKDDGSLDFEALERLLEWHISEGTDGLVIAGTTGESATIDFEEHRRLIRFAVARVNHRVPVIAGTGANATREALELTRSAAEYGADYCLLVVPYYNKPNQEGLYQHFSLLAKQVAIPQIIYNVPGRTVTDILPPTVHRLARDHANVVGIKDATGDMQRLSEMRQLIDRDFAYLSGDDKTALTFMRRGGRGGISVTANVAPALSHRMYARALAQDWKAAEADDDLLQGLHNELFCEPNPIPVKWALARMGKCQSGIRLPLVALADDRHEQVLAAMQQAGVTT